MPDDAMPPQDPAKTGVSPSDNPGILTDPVDAFSCQSCGNRIDVKGLPPFSDIICNACNTTNAVPVKLGNFLLLRLIGTGGMGGVYFARDEQLGRDVAIKVMLQSLGEDPQFIETFRHEAQAVAKLNHANIAQIYSFGQEKGQPYIVMELVSGERVDELMERPGGISKVQALRIGLEISQGLSAADEAGLVHGDIKPENILLDKKGNAKLVDFGLATVAHQNAGEGIWGTPYYIAPEKIRRQKLDARSDIYSLGATLYHMLTGSPPFEGETPVEVVKARLDAPPPDPRNIDPDLPAIVSDIILRMLAPERSGRYPNYRSLISDFRKALQAFETQEASKPPALSGGKSIRIKKRSSPKATPSRASTTNTPPEAAGTGTRKLVINKPGRVKIRTAGDTGNKRSHRPELSEEERAARRERRKRQQQRALATTLTILAFIFLAGGATFFWYYHSERISGQRTLHEQYTSRQQAAAHVAAITAHREQIETVLSEIKPLIAGVRDTAEYMNIPIPLDFVVVPPDSTSTNQVATTNAVVGDQQQPDSDPAPDPDLAPEPAPDPVPGQEVADHSIPVIPDTEAVVVTNLFEATPESTLVEEALTKEKAIADLIQDLAGLETETREKLANHKDDAGPDTTRAMGAEIAQAHAISQDAVATAQQIARELQETIRNLAAIRERFEIKEQQRLAAEREAQRQADQRAAEEQARIEREATTRRELAQIPALEQSVRNLLDINAFEEAYNQLKAQQDSFTTAESQTAFSDALERLRYLAAMKANIIEGINTAPYPWGYGSGATARDITGASAEGIQAKGIENPIPWQSILPTLMLKLIDRYIDSRAINVRQRIEIAFGAAIYADLFGEQGRERARYYATRALDLGLKRQTFERVLEARWAPAPAPTEDLQ